MVDTLKQSLPSQSVPGGRGDQPEKSAAEDEDDEEYDIPDEVEDVTG